MLKRIFMTIAVFGITALICSSSFAMCGMCGDDHGKSDSKPASTAVKVNNIICPVMGEKIDMKNPVTVEHDGKIYNLCCSMCVEKFKKDPQEYISKIEAQKK